MDGRVFNISGRDYKLELSELSNDMKMLCFLGGELSNSAKYFSSFANVSYDNMSSLQFTFGQLENIKWRPWNSERWLPYLPVYKSIPCISRPPNMGAKITFFFFLCKNFLEKLLFYLRISFQICNGFMKKTTPSLDVKFTISLTRAVIRVLATRV